MPEGADEPEDGIISRQPSHLGAGDGALAGSTSPHSTPTRLMKSRERTRLGYDWGDHGVST